MEKKELHYIFYILNTLFSSVQHRAHLKIDGQGPCISSVQSTPLRSSPFHSISNRDECKKMQPSVKSNKTSTQNGHEWEEGQLMRMWMWMRMAMRLRNHHHGRNPWRTQTQTHHVDGPDRRLLTMFKCQLGLLTGHFVDGILYSALGGPSLNI